jgi:hypothetical protein
MLLLPLLPLPLPPPLPPLLLPPPLLLLHTLRGSAEYTPSTSVQMVMCPLRNSAPMMVAEKSLPLRFSVVAWPLQHTHK